MEASPGTGSAGAARPQRLIIQKMVLENFKSYAGVQEIGPFEKCFSAVVGPNGSGKSNVIDAMLFVFGKRAKQMRQAKVSDLIHSSEQHRELPHARVVVHFADIVDLEGDAYEVVPGSELEVSRVAYRDASSRYFVDGRPSTFGEVTALCKKRGVDLDHNRFLILQGEVEQIAMMKPKAPSPHEDGLLEYLEDLIGSNRHVDAIGESSARVEALTEQRGSMLNRLKAVEREKDALEGAKDEAVEYVRLEHELACKRGAMYQIYLAEATTEMEEIESKRAELQAKLEHERAKASDLERERSAAESEAKSAAADAAKLGKKAAKAKAEFGVFEKRDIEAREQLKSLKAQQKKAKAALEKEAKHARELAATAERAQQDGARHEAEAERLGAEVAREEAKVAAMYENVAGEMGPLREQLEALQAERAPLATAVAGANSGLAELRAESQLLEQKASAGATKAAAAAEAAERAAAAREAKHAARDEAKRAALDASKAHDAAVAAAERAASDVGAAADAHARASAALEEGKAAAAAAKGQSAVVSALLAASAKGELSGVHGRLGGLGSIDAKYDVAISTACAALDHIVVESAEAATACVELLRRRQLGVATFVMLDKIAHLAPRAAAPFEPPAGAKRLFDLVKPTAAAYLPAFYFALGDTLVADSLDAATAVAFAGGARRRTVSLQGHVVDTSGTMSGGGSKVMRGRLRKGAGAAADASADADGDGASAARLEKAAADAAADVDAARRAHAAAKEAVAAAAKRAREAGLESKKADAAARSADAQAADAERQQHAAHAARAASDLSAEEAARREALGAELAAAQRALEAAEARLAKADAKVGAVQAKMDAAGGTAFKLQKARLASAQEALGEATRAGASATLQAEASSAAAAKADKAMERLRADGERLAAELEATAASLKQLEAEAAGALQALTAAQEAADEQAAAVEAAQAALRGADETLSKVKSVEVDITGQLDEYKRALKELKHKTSHWGEKMAALREAVSALAEEHGPALAQLAEAAAAAAAAAAASTPAGAEATPARGGGKRAKRGAKQPAADDADDAAPEPLSGELPELTAAELARVDARALQKEIAAAEERVGRLAPNMKAIADYQAKEGEWLGRLGEFDSTCAERDGARAELERLRKARHEEFMGGFLTISAYLKEMYQMITLGGDAELELVDSLDPFSEGIVFSVRPPRKSWKQIGHLSGGEKTLSSLALVFALHRYKPTPLYVMDEIDAALDFKNVSIVGNYIKERTRDAQFIVISLRNNMFELADRLVGIYKTDNCTKSVAINPGALAPALERATATPAVPAS